MAPTAMSKMLRLIPMIRSFPSVTGRQEAGTER
jgi:hypothetical protein